MKSLNLKSTSALALALIAGGVVAQQHQYLQIKQLVQYNLLLVILNLEMAQDRQSQVLILVLKLSQHKMRLIIQRQQGFLQLQIFVVAVLVGK